MTTKVRPKLDEIADYMKKLDDRHIGTFVNINQKERAYFKLLPEDDHKESICSIANWIKMGEYISNFKKIDTKYITLTQFNRLLASSPYSTEEMAQYEIYPRK